MAGNTIMTAKSTFGDGLLMDFAPDNTQATCLTHALNATLLTMNGNELSLQNDMGNGRVETAYLPEGYIPVGTCEFGDIIYIVSYNPITNKSQIGCFPSPERNISSKELSGIETTFELEEEFLKQNEFDFKETISNSVKKVIYDNKLNPGDKFIVHSGDIHDNMPRISDYGNKSHIVGAFPKQFKINVVAIEDSGKINYLNNDLKWYNDFYINQESTNNSNKPDIDSYRNLLSSGYSVFQSKVSGKLAILIELERIQAFNSTYEVLKNKDITKTIESTTVNYQQYDIYINFNWKTNNLDVNPKSIVIYDFKWVSNSGNDSKAGQYYVTGDKEAKVALLPEISKTDETKKYIELEIKGQADTNDYDKFSNSNYQTQSKRYKGHTKITQQIENGIPEEGKYYLDLHHIVDGKYYNNKGDSIGPEEVYDCIVNNYFKSSITKKGFTINIPDTDSKRNKIDKRDLILSFKVAPMMKYGVLSDLVQTHYIDFSKIGSGEINLEGYKYYIGENLCTLQIDSSIYPEDNKGVAEIEVQFYDNQGLCAKYFINNLVSYSGIITEYIPLNGNSSNYKLSKQHNKKLIPHAGQMFTDREKPENVDTTLSYVYLNTEIEDGGKLKPVEVIYNKEDKTFYKDNDNKVPVTIGPTSPIFYNDAGTLYSNMLYAVKIIYKYTSKNVLGEYNTEGIEWDHFEWRWLWTNTMFNQYYYNTKDFKDNQFELTLDIGAQYYANFKTKDITGYEGPQNDTSDIFKGLGLNLNYINNGEIQYTADLGLQNTYNSFSLKKGSSTDNISVNIYSGNSYIQIQDNIQNNEYLRQSNDNIAPNNISKKYEYIIKKQGIDTSGIANPWDSKDAYKNYKPLFTSTLNAEEALDTIEYVGNDLKSYNSSLGVKSTLKKLCTRQSLKINLVNPTLYIKTYINQTTAHKEMINLIQKGYEEYGLTLEGDSFNFNYVYSLWANRSGDDGKDKQRYIVKWNQNKTLGDINEHVGDLDYFKVGDAKEKWDEINKMAEMAELWQIRKAYGTSEHSIWKSNGDYFLREGKYDVNTSASFDLPNGFFINLLNFGSNQTYISKTNDTNNALRDKIFSNNEGFQDNNIYAQLAFNYGGDIHLLNDYINISAKGTNSNYLKVALQDLASKWAGWLANTYVLNQSNVVSSLQLNELIYSNSVTTFTKDIIYCTKIASNNSQLLLNNYDYSKYLEQIQKHSNNTSNSNVTIQFNNVIKNIPIQIQLKSLIPVRPQQSQNITIKPFADRTFDNIYISNISANNLYCIQNDTMIPINNNQEVYALTSYSESKAVFSENKCRFSIPKTFMYQDESLIPKKSSSAGIQLYSQKFVGSGWGGAIKDLLISDTILVEAKHVK